MIFTLYYVYATLLQWWKLGSLKNKLYGTLHSQNALLVCDKQVVFDAKKTRSFENLLFHFEDRIGCTIVPRQTVKLSNWLGFPKDPKYFPIYFRSKYPKIDPPHTYILLQAVLNTYEKHSASIIPRAEEVVRMRLDNLNAVSEIPHQRLQAVEENVEQFGELVAWRLSDYFEVIVKTDLNKLTKLVHCFSQSTIDVNHELKLLKIESVDVDGSPTKIKYDKQFSFETTQKYSCAAVHWKSFVESLKELHDKFFDVNRKPIITIENGKSEDKIVPVNQVRPIKKENKKSEEKNNLEVVAVDYRRHKSTDHKRDRSAEKPKTSHEKGNGAIKKENKVSAHEKRLGNKDKTHRSSSCKTNTIDDERVDKKQMSNSKDKLIDKSSKKDKCLHDEGHDKKESHKKHSSQPHGSKTRRTSSSDKKLVKSVAICDEPDFHLKEKTSPIESKTKIGDSTSKNKLLGPFTILHNNFSTVDKSLIVKPPNVLVYADSFVAKENVKAALTSILNRDKYIIYDLPMDAEKVTWDECAKLIVVCGAVPSNLTYHLLEYLINDGQLLCLCSDFLNSVLHTFTTAEVREHELVRFSYGKWKQVKMMHHIFCYQASPAKKQFSKDSDHSNHSSNGSSPVAPRTPTAVELSHNGKDYTIQVQVLGTEETWQTPSLLLATVKGSTGRAVFSQVHLEINPVQYEDDENKFEALKESDAVRLEILRDLLSNHLELNCTNTEILSYTPGYFLGRHEMKLKLLNGCEFIKNNLISNEKLTIKFCGKDEKHEAASVSFLPIYIHSCPTNFSTVNYFEALQTESIGRLVIYTDVITSSQNALIHKLSHGLVVISRQQTQGQGRSNNVWLSPLGSACFSLQLHVPLDSPLGKALPLIQHLVMVSVITAIKEKRGYKELCIGIKWPNDLYANKTTKIGGILVNTTIVDKLAIVNIGCGINLNNDDPTLSINSLITKINDSQGTAMHPIQSEIYFATVFNEIENFYNSIQRGDVADFYEHYYKYWLHSNSKVNVTTTDGNSEIVKIVGIDEYGYLRVKSKNGTTSRVQPDGNTFDMMRGLIIPKST